MLVLSRQIGQKIIIDSSIVIQVVEVRNGRVRLAIEAPPEVAIVREEIYQNRAVKADPCYVVPARTVKTPLVAN